MKEDIFNYSPKLSCFVGPCMSKNIRISNDGWFKLLIPFNFKLVSLFIFWKTVTYIIQDSNHGRMNEDDIWLNLTMGTRDCTPNSKWINIYWMECARLTCNFEKLSRNFASICFAKKCENFAKTFETKQKPKFLGKFIIKDFEKTTFEEICKQIRKE